MAEMADNECTICFANEVEITLHCGHGTCQKCIQTWLSVHIRSHDYPLTCCTCRQELQDWEIQEIVPVETLELYNQHLLEKMFEDEKEGMWCECGNLLSTFVGVCRVQCPKCDREKCYKCRADWHPNSSCQDYQLWKKKNRKTEETFHALITKGTIRRCPKCLTSILKNGGCDHMTCKKCKYEWYWSTGKMFANGNYKEKEYAIPDEYNKTTKKKKNLCNECQSHVCTCIRIDYSGQRVCNSCKQPICICRYLVSKMGFTESKEDLRVALRVRDELIVQLRDQIRDLEQQLSMVYPSCTNVVKSGERKGQVCGRVKCGIHKK